MPDASVVTAVNIPHGMVPGARIGIDLVRVERVEQSLQAFGARFVERLFAAGERRDCTVDGRLDACRLALRFAAKEAVIKAFDLSEAGIGWALIEMTECAGSAGRIRLHGRAAEAAAHAGPYEIAVQSSLEGGLACAIVVALPQ